MTNLRKKAGIGHDLIGENEALDLTTRELDELHTMLQQEGLFETLRVCYLAGVEAGSRANKGA